MATNSKPEATGADPAAPWAEPVLYTAEDLMALPDDAWRYELVRGRLVRMPPAGFDHGDIGMEIGSVLRRYVREHGLGRVTAETGFLVSLPDGPDTVLAPEAAFVAAARVPPRGSPEARGYPRLAPDLVVEVASPSQSRPQMAAKARLWLDSGVRRVWLIWPTRRTVDAWRQGELEKAATLSETDVLDGEDVVPGFRYPVADLFT